MATWSAEFVDSLPDSAFLVVEDGGKHDTLGRTIPRSLRHFPVFGPDGKVDLPHVRNALARIPQSDLSQAVKDRATKEAQRILDRETSNAKSSAPNGEIMAMACNLEIIEAAEGEPKKLPRFNMNAYNGGPLKLGNFSYPVYADLDGMNIPTQKVPVRLQHDPNQGVGHTDRIEKAGHSLNASGVISRDTPAAKDVVSSAANGFPWQASINATINRREFVPEGSKAQVNGQTAHGPAIIARASTLRELTCCDLGADHSTSVNIAAKLPQEQGSISMPEDTTPELNEAQRFNGFRLAATAYEGRVAGLPQIQARAIEENWTLREFELHLIRAARPQATPSARNLRPDIVSACREQVTGRDLLAASGLCLFGGEAIVEKAYGPIIAQQARDLRIHSVEKLCEASILADGRNLPAGGRGAVIEAAFTTASLPGILSNAMNKVLLTQYQAVLSVAKQIAKKLTANDFKVHTGYRLTGDATLQPVGPNGELAHGSLGEQAYPYQVGTFERTYGITRQMMKNDDLGSLYEIPAMCGRGAALAVEKAFWILLLANTGSFFAAGNNNYISGATTNLSSVALAQAVAAFRNQVDPQGNPILLTPKYLVIPTSLEETAWELFKSTNVMIAGSTDRLQAMQNIYAGLYQPCITPYLNNTTLPGSSNTAWYLFGEPGDVAAFGIAYLDGNEMPTIQDAPQNPDVLGIGWRVFFDFGVCQLDPRGAVKSKGAA